MKNVPLAIYKNINLASSFAGKEHKPVSLNSDALEAINLFIRESHLYPPYSDDDQRYQCITDHDWEVPIGHIDQQANCGAGLFTKEAYVSAYNTCIILEPPPGCLDAVEGGIFFPHMTVTLCSFIFIFF